MPLSPYQEVGARLVERGYSAIPIAPGKKFPGHIVGGEYRPLFDWSRFCDRLPTEIEIAHWAAMPNCGVGIAATHEINFTDIDTINPKIIDVMRAILPLSPAIKTGQKGETLFYRADFPTRHFDINGERVLDWLGHGTQTVLPPSIHERTGRPYTWIGLKHLPDLNPDELPIVTPDNMAELIAALEKLGYQEPVPHQPYDGDDNSPFRKLNNAALANLDAWVPRLGLARCKRVRNGYRAVPEWRASHTCRPLEQRGLNLKIHPGGIKDFHDGDRGYTPINLVMAALGLGDDNQRAFNLLSKWLGRVPDNVILIEDHIDHETGEIMEAIPDDPHDFPDEDLILPGYLGEISDWIMQTSMNPIRLFATAAALSIVGSLTARRVYCSAPRLGTNLYMLIVAGTGGGKERPQACAKQLLDAIGASDLHMADVASASSLAMRLAEKPATLQIVDEIDKVFRKVGGRNSSSQETDLMQAYCTLWGLGISAYTPSRTTLRGAEPIVRPSLAIFGASTPEAFFEHLRGKMLDGGFLNRFLVLQRHKRVPRNQDIQPDEWLPESLILKGKRLFGFQDIRPAATDKKHFLAPSETLQNPKNPPELYVVSFAPRAMAMRDELMDERERKLADSDIDTYMRAWTRFVDMTQRVALIVSCGRCAEEGLNGCMIEEADMAFAEKFVRWSIDNFINGLRENMAENEHQANSKLVLKYIRGAGSKITHRELLHSLNCRIDANQLKSIINLLADGGQIKVSEERKPGKPGPSGRIYTIRRQ